MKAIRIFLLVLILSSLLGLFATGCSEQEGHGFAIYLTGRNPGFSPPSETTAISGNPILSISDLEAYDRNHHWLTLTPGAMERLAQLDVPVSGLEFAVCVDRQVVYVGAFWMTISSLPYDGPVIIKPYAGQDSRSISIELGYPSSGFFTGSDPRSDPKIFAGLAGRLIG
jgi:hypothetical protein